MAKRLTDTNKWEEQWYRLLPPEYKCLWEFIHSTCDFSGIWESDFTLASFYIGKKIAEKDFRVLFQDKIVNIKGTNKWILPRFIEFQYGKTFTSHHFHLKIINHLKNNLIPIELLGIDINKQLLDAPYVPYRKSDLQRPKWKKKRLEILERDNHKCIKCPSTVNLDVHHKRYIEGNKLWEYENEDLETLCDECHTKEHKALALKNRKK